MKNSLRMGLIVTAIWTSMVGFLATGCASGGYKLTRQYAGFVNRQNIVLRIVLYILTSIVFAVTLLADAVIFNTMDFWKGRVSQGDFHFQDAEKKYAVQHRLDSTLGLRSSRIEVITIASGERKLVELKEVTDGQIELYIDGLLSGRVDNIESVPQITFLNGFGKSGEKRSIFSERSLALHP